MKLRALAYPVVVSALLNATSANVAAAQESGQLNVLLASIAHGQKSVTLRFIVSNGSKATIYVRNFSFDKAEEFPLKSGDTLRYPQVAGVQECRHDLGNCLGQNSEDINEYSAVEPGKSVPLSLTFLTQKVINEADTVSGSVALVVRFASPIRDAGPARLIKFPFLGKPIDWK